jgi:hypothetical protein
MFVLSELLNVLDAANAYWAGLSVVRKTGND